MSETGRNNHRESEASENAREPLDVSVIQAATRDLLLGNPLLYFPVIQSTSTKVMELARKGASIGLLVITDEQTAGRGRIGRTWKSLPGKQLEFSVLLAPTFPAQFLVMASALSVAEAVFAVTGVTAGIKWPNDVQVDDRKVAGILIETTTEFAVLGIGLNVNGSLADDPDLGPLAMTLADATGRQVSREALAAELLRKLDRYYADLSSDGDAGGQAKSAIWDGWRRRLVTLGRHVRVAQGDTTLVGIAEEVDAGGSLMLRLPDGTLHTINWGDVSS